jgi:hypothetical protein
MSQNDYTIANQTTPLFRADLNSALQALASNSSGATAPATTYANMFWYDTSANILKMRSEADDAWINVAYVDQSANAWRVLDNTQVVDTSGTTIGYLGVQVTSFWQSGVSTNDSLVSPAKVKAAIEALVPNVLNASGTAPLYACRAWVNFNGTGTVAIRASGNVSSITDLGIGTYRVNFTTAMQDANYSAQVSCGLGNSDGYASLEALDASFVQLNSRKWNAFVDAPLVYVAIFR